MSVLSHRSRLVLEVTLTRGAWRHEQRLFLEKRRGESMGHVTMKLLAWALYTTPDEAPLAIEQDVGQHYKPDVLRLVDAQPRLWIDCGATTPKKLAAVVQKNRRTTVVIVKRERGELSHYRSAALARLPDGHGVQWLAFDDGFVERIAERLWGRHRVAIDVGARLSVTVDDVPDETSRVVLPSDDEPHNVQR